MRTKAEGIGVTLDLRPQVWEEPVLESGAATRSSARSSTRTSSGPTAYRKKALPIMRHLALAYRATREPSPRTISSCSAPISWQRR